MKSTVFLIIISLMFVCVGWLIGGIFTPIFTGIGAVIATITLIKIIIQRRRSQ